MKNAIFKKGYDMDRNRLRAAYLTIYENEYTIPQKALIIADSHGLLDAYVELSKTSLVQVHNVSGLRPKIYMAMNLPRGADIFIFAMGFDLPMIRFSRSLSSPVQHEAPNADRATLSAIMRYGNPFDRNIFEKAIRAISTKLEIKSAIGYPLFV